MRKIDVQQLVILADGFTGKQVEVALSPVNSRNIYQQFRCRESGNNLEFYDINIDKPTPNELIISEDTIREILYYEGETVYDEVFSIILDNNGQVDFCIYENPLFCKKCHKLLDRHCDLTWQINQIGGYGSIYDNKLVCVEVCDNCLMDFINDGNEYKEKDLLN